MRPGGRGEEEKKICECVCVSTYVCAGNKEVWGCGRKVKLKEAKGQRQRRLRCEKGGIEGYLKDISQSVGEEKKDRGGEGGEAALWDRGNEKDGRAHS